MARQLTAEQGRELDALVMRMVSGGDEKASDIAYRARISWRGPIQPMGWVKMVGLSLQRLRKNGQLVVDGIRWRLPPASVSPVCDD